MILRRVFFVLSIVVSIGVVGCVKTQNTSSPEMKTVSEAEVEVKLAPVERIDTLGTIVLYPKFSRVDLACGVMPSKQDSSVILMVAGSYTGKTKKVFEHSNIAGNHVSGGVWYKGYHCHRYTGSFFFYNNTWKFVYAPNKDKNYNPNNVREKEMKIVAEYGGSGFSQEMILHNGEVTPTCRPGNNKNIFRALCALNNRLCIVQSQKIVQFKEFVALLQQLGVTDALYLDMGAGWNYGWYREENGQVYELFNKRTIYSTNWVTFYK